MIAAAELFHTIVTDFGELYRAYAQGSLFSEDRTNLWKTLLGDSAAIYRFTRDFLLVDALIRNRVGSALFADGNLRHAVVFGGTKVGKSSVVNIIGAERLAETSVEGGYTRHACAFGRAIQPGLDGLFAGNPRSF